MLSKISKKQARLAGALLSALDKSPNLSKEEGTGASCIVVDEDGKILLGKRTDNLKLDLPGGGSEGSETPEETAKRELKEEACIIASKLTLMSEITGSKCFLVKEWKGVPADSTELAFVNFYDPKDIDLKDLTDRSRDILKQYLSKTLLSKNILRHDVGLHVVHEVTHGDALKLIGTAAFRWLNEQVAGMGQDDFREIKLDNYNLKIRKHSNDVYSGSISDGHKAIHQFVNKSLPALTADLMSLFEWYDPDQEPSSEQLDDKELENSEVTGGLKALVTDYKKNSMTDLYHEMENIREEIRSGNAVDLQQVEQKIMKLFDKLEDNLHSVVDKHNKLSVDAGKEIDDLHNKLLLLQDKISDMSKQKTIIEAAAPNPEAASQIHDSEYMYLPKPIIEVSGDGRVRITFSGEWTSMEKENFLHDMKARIIKRADKNAKS